MKAFTQFSLKSLSVLIIFLLAQFEQVYSQTYTMTNGGSISACSGTFFDPGGTGNYTYSNAGTSYSNHKGWLKGLFYVWIMPQGMANLLSIS